MSNEYTFKLSPVSDAFIRHLVDTTGYNRHEVLNSILLLYLDNDPVLAAWYDQYLKRTEDVHRGVDPTIDMEEFARRLNDWQGDDDDID